MGSQPTIGVFDSGVGGLTVVRAVRAAVPGAHVVYLGDTARVPYGSKSPATVERYSLACLRFLLGHGAEEVLIACNTASATALPAVTAASPVPVIGTVETGARQAVARTRNGRIGLLGTLATVRSGAYEHAVRALDPAATLAAVASPLLVPLAEEGWLDGAVPEAVAAVYLEELLRQGPDIDTLVLGCTHYPLLRQVIGETVARLAGRAIELVDSAEAMAEALRSAQSAAADPAEAGSLRCFVTDESRMEELGPRFLGEALDRYEVIDLTP